VQGQVAHFDNRLATPSDTGAYCALASSAPSNNGLHDDTAPDNKHNALCPATPADGHNTPPFAPFFPPPHKALPATQHTVYAAHDITNLEDAPDAPLHAAHTPLLSAMHHASPDATPLLNLDAFGNELATILDTYHALDAAPLNSAPRAPPQPADSALLLATHTLPLPGTPTTTPRVARSVPLPATGSAPVPPLEELLNNMLCAPFWAPCGMLFTHPMLCNMALNTHAQHKHL
jgi:hypothetical protein